MASATIIDLRTYHRNTSSDLFVFIGGRIARIASLSSAGLSIDLPGELGFARNIGFWIVPRAGRHLDVARALPVNGHIVARNGREIRIIFAAINMALANIIGQYAADDEDEWDPSSSAPPLAAFGPGALD
ncbi:MAG: hypothetical protein F8N37_11860 [Telmatospirillum sp.]|nr:hypothetical protein [Telmatospirillum sp.]